MILSHYGSFSAPVSLDVVDDFGTQIALPCVPENGFRDPTFQACLFSSDGHTDPAFHTHVWGDK